MNWVEFLKDKFIRRNPKRHGDWTKVRNEYLRENPQCAVCGLTTKTEVHHIIPIWVAPQLELDPQNLMTLCMNGKYGVKCHLFFGHHGNWRNVNMECRQDVRDWRGKIKTSQKL